MKHELLNFLHRARVVSLRFFEILETIFVVPVLVLIFLIGLRFAIPNAQEIFESVFSADEYKLTSDQVLSFVLPIVAFLAFALIRHINKSEKEFASLAANFDSTAARLIGSVHGVEYVEFDKDTDLKRYLIDHIRIAQQEICDFTWAHRQVKPNTIANRSPAEQDLWERQEREYSKTIDKVARKVAYREIFILSRLDRLKKLEARFKAKAAGYYCCVLPDSPIPRIQFVVIDRKEIIFVSSNHRILCSVKHPQLVVLLLNYFEDAWMAGTELVTNVNGTAVWDDALTEQTIAAAASALRGSTAVESS